MGLSQEELKKINELQNTAQLQHGWKAIRNIITWRERVKKYLILICNDLLSSVNHRKSPQTFI